MELPSTSAAAAAVAAAAKASQALSDVSMNHFLLQLKQINKFNGDPLYLALFIKEVDELVYHYPTTSEGQNQIVQAAIRNLLVGQARSLLMRNIPQDWKELRTLLISEFNSATPPHRMIAELREIKYKNNLRKFVEELEEQTSRICCK